MNVASSATCAASCRIASTVAGGIASASITAFAVSAECLWLETAGKEEAAGGGTGGAHSSAAGGLFETGLGSCTGAPGTAGVPDFPAAICSNPPVRQSPTLLFDFDFPAFAAGTSSWSPAPSRLQADGCSSSSSATSSESRSRQSCSIVNGEPAVVK